MGKPGMKAVGLFLCLLCAIPSQAADKKESVDFEHEETFIDMSDALRSKQYVHRAILNSLVKDTTRFSTDRFYLSHMMGYNQIYQRGTTEFAKFSSGLQGVALGYISKGGHGVELGFEISAVSNLFIGYKYFLRPKNLSIWTVFGAGVGTNIKGMNTGDGPPEALLYTGPASMGFGSLGFLVPTIDVGFKGELRLNFYGFDRVVFTTGVGIILFL
jgi:hypothetical protein